MTNIFVLIAVLIGTNGAFNTKAIADDVTVKKINVKGVDYTNRLVKDAKGVEKIEIVDSRTGGIIATVDADENTKAQLLNKPQIQGGEVGNPIVGKNDLKVTKINVEGKDYIKRLVKDGKGVEKLELVDLHTGKIIATIDVEGKAKGNCEEVTDQYSVCDGNKYIRENNVSDSLKRNMKQIERSVGSENTTLEKKKSAK